MFLTFSFTSCQKEGCTDPAALNYDKKANKNDGSCEYKAEVVQEDSICPEGFYGNACEFAFNDGLADSFQVNLWSTIAGGTTVAENYTTTIITSARGKEFTIVNFTNGGGTLLARFKNKDGGDLQAEPLLVNGNETFVNGHFSLNSSGELYFEYQIIRSGGIPINCLELYKPL